MLKDFVSLVYPVNCVMCGNSLFLQERCICSRCRYRLPETGYHQQPENPVMDLFRGRVELHSAASYLEFAKKGKVQRLIHSLKYRGKQETGTELGKMYGVKLAASAFFNTVEIILPVPLHPSRLRRRGYNQSGVFAKGIAETMGIAMDERMLLRTGRSDTQTRKSRYDRWKNVENIFELGPAAGFENKHLLLVDDVVTTGSTLEACVLQLKKIPGARVSIATLAYAPL